MTKKSVPFLCIPDLSKEKLHLGRDLSFDLHENDGTLSMSVEATRLGSDKRKITGWANMDQYQILRLWAGLDRLIRERGLLGEVQTLEEHDQARREQNAASQENFLKHRQRMVQDKRPQPLNNDQQAVFDTITLMEPDERPSDCLESIVDDVSQRILAYVFNESEKKAVVDCLKRETATVEQTKPLNEDQKAVADYIISIELAISMRNDEDSIADAVNQAMRFLAVDLTEGEEQAVCEFLINRDGKSA